MPTLIRSLPPLERLRECFKYFPDTGELTWKKRPESHFPTTRAQRWWNSRYAGRKAGWVDREGYLQVRLDNRVYRAHRVCYGLATGCNITALEIDHINGDKSDNRFINLRVASRGGNSMNRIGKRGRETLKNIYKTGSGKWAVSVVSDGVTRYFGSFTTLEEAKQVAAMARVQYHGKFAHHGSVKENDPFELRAAV